MNIINKIVLILVLITLAGLIAFYLYYDNNSTRTAYINTVEVFDGFTLKQELAVKLNETKNARQEILDSLEMQIRILAGTPEQEGKNVKQKKITKAELLKQEYYLKKQKFGEDNTALSQQYDKQIWNQLNQYIKDYGKEQDYDLILGATGSGNLMYAKEGMDITGQVTEYVNNRYSGLKE